jgi:hypothetical protein
MTNASEKKTDAAMIIKMSAGDLKRPDRDFNLEPLQLPAFEVPTMSVLSLSQVKQDHCPESIRAEKPTRRQNRPSSTLRRFYERDNAGNMGGIV